MKLWLMSTNHKYTGILYFSFELWSGILGLTMSMIIRMELGNLGSLIGNYQIYNAIYTTHAFIMIFFCCTCNNSGIWKLFSTYNFSSSSYSIPSNK